MLKPAAVWLLILCGFSGLGIASALPIAAQTFHNYSVAGENTFAGSYTGVSTTRYDTRVANLPNNGCTGYFQGNSVYQAEWLAITPDGQNWLELGTGHQCRDTLHYWYAGYGYLGGWYPLWEDSNVAEGDSHRFSIAKIGSTYYYAIDTTFVASQNSSSGQDVQSGIESYASTAQVSAYSHNTLQYTQGGSSNWTNWSGEDTQLVGPSMCGRWQSPTSWIVAENALC